MASPLWSNGREVQFESNTNYRSAPENDTELTQNGIEFVGRILYKTPGTLLLSTSSELIEFFFVFTLKVLVGKEPLPKAAAADFWVRLQRNKALGIRPYVI